MLGVATKKGKSYDNGSLFRADDNIVAIGSLYSSHGTLGKLITWVEDRVGPSDDRIEGQELE
jgi:hypothetical protein